MSEFISRALFGVVIPVPVIESYVSFVNISNACASTLSISPSNDEWAEVMTNYYGRYTMNHAASVYREE